MQRLFVLAAVGVFISGCAVQKDWIPTGGSRGDGTVKMSFEFGGFEKPIVDNAKADAAAQQRCAAWGYSGAERFEGIERNCLAANQYGCVRYRVTATYQCTGQPEKAR